MEKKTVDTLRVMLCGELDDIVKEGKLTHESLDIVKDLLESMKALEKIEKMEREKEFEEMEMNMGNMGGYSQRSVGRYMIDGLYGNGGNSYRNSYARNESGGNYNRSMNSYAGQGSSNMGNSYMYYDPMYNHPMYSMRGYSTTDSKNEVMEKLMDLMKETNDESVKTAISEAINMMNQ